MLRKLYAEDPPGAYCGSKSVPTYIFTSCLDYKSNNADCARLHLDFPCNLKQNACVEEPRWHLPMNKDPAMDE